MTPVQKCTGDISAVDGSFKLDNTHDKALRGVIDLLLERALNNFTNVTIMQYALLHISEFNLSRQHFHH